AAGPEDTPCHKVQVTRIFDRLVVMTDRGAKHTRLALIEAGPRDDNVALVLLAASQRLRAVEHLDVVVELLVDRRPVCQPFGDRTIRVSEPDGDGKLRAMTA